MDLNNNGVQTSICTGDNIFTAIKTGVDLQFFGNKTGKIMVCDVD